MSNLSSCRTGMQLAIGGDMEDADLKANRDAVAFGARIFSSCKLGEGRMWVITEADRSATAVLLP